MTIIILFYYLMKSKCAQYYKTKDKKAAVHKVLNGSLKQSVEIPIIVYVNLFRYI